jgi:hypothetical protein
VRTQRHWLGYAIRESLNAIRSNARVLRVRWLLGCVPFFPPQGYTAGKVRAHEPWPPLALPADAGASLATTGALYGWRMHAGQGTRNSGRCSADNLRRCKVFYLAQHPSGPAHGRHVQVT